VRIDLGAGEVRFKVIGDDRWSDEFGEGESPGATGICGSGIIEVVGELFVNGLIDSSGLFVEDAEERLPSVRFNGRTAEIVLATPEQSATASDIVVTQNDIRQIQLGKGALYAGARILMDHLSIEHVDRIKLAGAFGSYIDPKYAMIIGLIPDCDLANVETIGNAAGDGARIALLNTRQRVIAQQAARDVEYVETAAQPDFQDKFIAAMGLPHSTDPFPHLSGIVPEEVRQNRAARRRHRKRAD
jgi:uncharacterized 2Fe-2S/4Fe-4S cluster protein (DUF4445 family)